MKNFFFMAGLLVLSYCVKAQYTLPADPTNKQVTSPSPDVWQFAKYGEYLVSRETGVPSINIPLYTINTGELSVPISVSYHAGGIKVDDVPSWVGLGWTLNAGGIVSRVTKSRPDEDGNGLLNLKASSLPFVNSEGIIDMSQGDVSSETDYSFLMQMMDGLVDCEPDIFNYNFAGYSGRFFLDPNPAYPTVVTSRNGVTQPKSDVLIRASIVSNQIPEIVIIAPDGTKYTFSEETTYSGVNFVTNSSWYLSSIQNANATETIKFYYVDVTQNFENTHRNETQSVLFKYPTFNSNPIVNPTRQSPENGTYDHIKLLQKIEFPAGRVVFNSSIDPVNTYNTRITSIDIFDNDDLTIPLKSFIFNNSTFFVSTGSPSVLNSRLKLSSIQEKGTSGSLLPPYEFTYLETGIYQLPPRLSKAQDYWGYYNGKNSNASLVPLVNYTYTHTTTGGTNTSFTIGNADRNPDAESMKAGIIQKIKYPTRGTTEFTFQPNVVRRTYNTTPPSQPQPIMQAYVYTTGGGTLDMLRTFTPTTNGTGTARFNMSTSAANVHGNIYIKDNGITILSFTDTYASTYQPINIIAGHTYELYAKASDFTTSFVTIDWSSISTPTVVTADQIVGGLRIATIKNFDTDGVTLVSQKKFTYEVPNTGYSSGKYNSINFPTPESFIKTSQLWGGNCEYGIDFDISVSAYPANQLGYPSGNVVTYEYVIEQDGDGQNLKGSSVYKYDVATTDQGVNFVNSFTMDRSWLRGQLLSESHYDKLATVGVSPPVRYVQYDYETIPFNNKIKGLKVAEDIATPGHQPCALCCQPGGCTYGSFCDPKQLRVGSAIYITYDEPINWKRLKSKTETQDGMTSTTSFEYNVQNNHTNIVAAQAVNSDGKIERKEIRYAHEVSQSSMIPKNMISIPLESDTKVNGVLMGGSRLTYGSAPQGTGTGLLLPIKFEERLPTGSYRTLKDIISVNANGKIEEFKTPNGVSTVLKWGYNNTLPIANIVNAQNTQVAYSGFEGGPSEGGWVYTFGGCTLDVSTCPSQAADPNGYAECYYNKLSLYNQCLINDASSKADSKSGFKSFAGSSISKSSLPVGNYILSFWGKGIVTDGSVTITGVTGAQTITAGLWKPYQFTLNSITSVTLSLTNIRIDDLRIYPQGSQISTYTFDPLLGMTSSTDANNAPQYYEYDAQGRLKWIKDQDGNIVKANDYHYKGN